ncbi:MAG: glucose-6-phosphate dehydrogenase [Gemmatimonadaceae bacterium]|nr:glucose-6-phosphate dehydrogenase [Gemmatimonadaceae bacterium]
MTAATPGLSLFVIFGASGDLSRRKILPALYQLHLAGSTSAGCVVLGLSRKPDFDDDAFRAIANGAIDRKVASAAKVGAWTKKYFRGQSIGDGTPDDYAALAARISALEAEFGAMTVRVFYVALPPESFPAAITGLGEAGLAAPVATTRLVIEKPFGHDLASSRALSSVVHQYFAEEQVYRIDHYLGKETVQNMLVFRFANAMFETLWNRNHIESVQITVSEDLGVEGRAEYYEHAGALTRRSVQGQLTQVAGPGGAGVPGHGRQRRFDAEQDQPALRAIAPIMPSDAVLGQYIAGQIDDKDVVGYREEPGVAWKVPVGSSVAAIRLHIENWRWQGVPFFLRTGKRLHKRTTEIEVKFRRAPVWMFRAMQQEELHRNTLLLTLQPNEGFSLYFDVKAPGEPFRVQRLPLHFDYAEAFNSIPEAYQTLLLDVLRGDQTLFVHAEEVEVAWTLFTPLLDGAVGVLPYPAGSDGPIEAGPLSSR